MPVEIPQDDKVLNDFRLHADITLKSSINPKSQIALKKKGDCYFFDWIGEKADDLWIALKSVAIIDEVALVSMRDHLEALKKVPKDGKYHKMQVKDQANDRMITMEFMLMIDNKVKNKFKHK
jgi:hypothetical protein